MYGGADGSFSGGAYGGSGAGGKGWGGLLKSVTKTAATLGKKGLKAAQVCAADTRPAAAACCLLGPDAVAGGARAALSCSVAWCLMQCCLWPF
jgi:hypothetical protein